KVAGVVPEPQPDAAPDAEARPVQID
ncbi:MAG: hypothetical protein QOD63_220, partial [Actinomycetota bacterium]|nr:hypothetical protein [Actinomycetota bacterium]